MGILIYLESKTISQEISIFRLRYKFIETNCFAKYYLGVPTLECNEN